MIGDEQHRPRLRGAGEGRLVVFQPHAQQAQGRIEEVLPVLQVLLVLDIELLELALAADLLDGLDDGALQHRLVSRGIADADFLGGE